MRFLARSKALQANLVTGASDCDPSAIVTCLQVGATTGFSLLWMFPLTTVGLIAVDRLATRSADKHGRGIARLVRTKLGVVAAWVVAVAFIAANVVTLTADIGGAAAIASDLFGVPRWTAAITIPLIPAILILRCDFAQVRTALLLLTPLFVLYLIAGIAAKPRPDIGDFVPHELSTVLLLGALGVVGSVLTPYVFFRQVEDSIQLRSRSLEQSDSTIGMILANVVLLAVVLTSASVLNQPGGSGLEISNLRQASDALEPLLGHAAFTFFGIGIIVSTVVGAPVIATVCGYAAMGAAGKRAGLNWPFAAARGFYGVAIVVLAGGGAFALLGTNPVTLLFWAQVINGALIPLLIGLFLVTNRTR
jgi:Mn2+/Fe2+ NRAMP family transporter